MATIDNLNISITQMTQDDLITLISKLRLSRRTKKKTFKTTTRKVMKKDKNPKDIFKSSSDLQRTQIIAALEEMMNEPSDD